MSGSSALPIAVSPPHLAPAPSARSRLGLLWSPTAAAILGSAGRTAKVPAGRPELPITFLADPRSHGATVEDGCIGSGSVLIRRAPMGARPGLPSSSWRLVLLNCGDSDQLASNALARRFHEHPTDRPTKQGRLSRRGGLSPVPPAYPKAVTLTRPVPPSRPGRRHFAAEQLRPATHRSAGIHLAGQLRVSRIDPTVRTLERESRSGPTGRRLLPSSTALPCANDGPLARRPSFPNRNSLQLDVPSPLWRLPLLTCGDSLQGTSSPLTSEFREHPTD